MDLEVDEPVVEGIRISLGHLFVKYIILSIGFILVNFNNKSY